jgi:hypothetical protein
MLIKVFTGPDQRHLQTRYCADNFTAEVEGLLLGSEGNLEDL